MNGMDWKLGLLCAMEAITPQQAAWFRITWRELAREGVAAEYGSVECYRVMAEWVVENVPEDKAFLLRFIMTGAGQVSQALPAATDDDTGGDLSKLLPIDEPQL